MPYPEYQHRVDELYKQYRRNPQMFTPEQIDELERLSQEAGLPFTRKQEEFHLVDTAKQAISGFVTGLTTLPVGEEPRTVYEKISHSLGHLAGFAPSILAAPMGLLTRGVAKIGTKKAISAAGRIKNSSNAALSTLDKISIPMIGSRYSKKLVDKALQKSNLEAYDFLKKGAKTRAILEEAIGLGTASTVSNIWAGPDEYMNTFVGGALAGGAFGGIGNFASIGNRLKFAKDPKQRQAAENALKMSLGASVTGVPAIMRDEPIESIIYELLLGGFFGYKTRPAHEAEGGKFYESLAYGSEPEIQFRPETHKEWGQFSKNAQGYVNKMSTEWARKYLKHPDILGDMAESKVQERAFLNTDKTMDQLKNEFGKLNKDGQELVDSAYREYAYKVMKTMPKNATDIVAPPSAVDDNDKLVDKEDVTDNALLTPRIVDLYKRLVRTMEKDDSIKVPIKSIDLASVIQASYKENAGSTPKSFLESLKRSELGAETVDKFKKDLTVWFHQTNKQMAPALIADVSGDKVVTYSAMGHLQGKNVGIKGDMPISENQPSEHNMLLTHVMLRDSKGKPFLAKPLDQIARYNSKTKQFEIDNVLTPDMLYKIQTDLYTNGKLPKDRRMIDSGVKDKPMLYVSGYHPETYKTDKGKQVIRHTPEDIDFRMGNPKTEVKVGDKTVEYGFKEIYKFSLDLMHDIHGVPKPKAGEKLTAKQDLIKEIHDAQWSSNVLKMADLNGVGMDNIKVLGGQEYYKNVIDFNKRRQGDFDRGVAMHPDAFRGEGTNNSVPNGKLKFAIFEDLPPEYLNTKLDSATDGTKMIRKDVFDDGADFMGSSDGIAFHKPVIKGKVDNQPTHIYSKSAGQRATDAWDAFMHEKGLHFIDFSSASKHKGNLKPVKWSYKDGKYSVEGSIAENMYTIPINKLRISLTSGEHPSEAIGRQSAPIQLSEILNFEQTGNAARRFVEEIIDPSINGEVEINDLFKPENIKNEADILKKIRSDKHFIDKMDLGLIHKMLANHPDSKITRALRKRIMKMERENISDDPFMEQDLEDISFRNTTILREGDLGFNVSHFNNFSKNQFEKAYDKYLMKRLRNPIVNSSGKVILRGIEPDVFDTGNITDKGRPIAAGEIILGRGMRRMPVKDPRFKNLGEMFDAIGKGEVVLDPKTGEFAKSEPIELVVIRVPADSVSGARVLKLRGFSKEGGTGALTHPKDDAYLGGADKDIDSAFIFEGFSKELKDAYKKNAEEWKDSMESKPQRDDDLFMLGKKLEHNDWLKLMHSAGHYQSSISKFSPSMRIGVARSSSKGNKAIGFGVTSKKKIYDIYNYELERGNIGKEIKREYTYKDSKGKEHTDVLIYTPTKESGVRIRDLGRQALNRAADAANYPLFVPMQKIPDIITSESFKNAMVSKDGKAPKPATARDFFRAYKDNISSIDAINPNKKNYSDGERKLMFFERQALMREMNPDFENGSLWGELNKRIRSKGLDADYRNDRLDELLDRTITGGLEGVAKAEHPRLSSTMYKQIMDLFDIQIQINSTMLKNKSGEQAYELLFHDLNQVAGRNAIVKSFEDVLSTIRDPEGPQFKNSDNAAIKALKDLVSGAIKVKQYVSNMQPSHSPEVAAKTSSEVIDNAIVNRKAAIGEALLPLKIPTRPFIKLYETILLSPFKVVGEARPTKNLRARQQAAPWNSRLVSDAAKRDYLTEFDSVVDGILGPKEATKETMKKIIYKPTKGFSEKPVSEVVDVRTDDFLQKLRYKAVRPEHIEQVDKLKASLKNYPDVAMDLEAHFDAWQLAANRHVKDISEINQHDIDGFTRFLRGKDPETFSYWNWMKDPNQVSFEQMRQDQLFFESHNTPVKTSDGIVKKSVKRMTSTFGAMKKWFDKSSNEKQFHIEQVHKNNPEIIKFRKTIKSRKTRDELNRLIVLKRESRREKVDSSLLQPEIDKLQESLSKKVKNLDDVVTEADAAYTADIKKTGREWIYGEKGAEQTMIDFNQEFMKDGIFNTEKFIKQIENAYTGKKFKRIPLNVQLKVFYEMTLNKLADKSKDPAAFREWYRNKHPFKKWEIGELEANEYWHKRYGNNKKDLEAINKFTENEMQLSYQKEYDRVINEGGTKSEAERKANIAANITKEGYDAFMERSKSDTGGVEFDLLDAIVSDFDYRTLGPKAIAKQLEGIGFFGRPNSVLERSKDLPVGFDTTPEAYDQYKIQLINSNYKNLAAIVADYRITDFVNRAPMDIGMDGKPIELSPKYLEKLKESSTDKFEYRNNSDVYADYLRLYLRDFMGYQTTFPERIIHAMNAGDPLKLKKNLYYGLSDQVAIQNIDRINKRWKEKFGKELPFLKDLPQGTSDKALKERAKIFSRFLKTMSRGEARYELLTLLANTGTMTANFFGGSSNIIGSAGFKNFNRANSNKWLTKNLLTDSDGKFYLKLSDGTVVNSKAKLTDWVAEKGVLDTLVKEEFEYNQDLQPIKDKLGVNFKEFMTEFGGILKKGKASDTTIMELFKRYGVGGEITKKGAWFMNTSERWLRANAFVSHAIRARNRFGKDGRDLRLDDPHLVEAGLDGIEATQYLYDAQSRPAFMRSSLGRMMSRFKLFAFKSVRLRKELFKNAREAGFKEGTDEFNKMKDLLLVDLFTMALGSMYAYSLFDTSLPPPWDWLQESSEWLFGDKRERDKAFFGMYPYPLAPLQIVTPPVARVPASILSSFVNDDWDRFADYHAYNMVPFGRIVRQVKKTVDEPYGTTFGRFMQQFFRLPTDKLVSKMERAKRREEDEDKIRRMLGD